MARDTWLQLLDEFEEQIPLFVRTFIAELESLALYDANLIPGDDIERTAYETMQQLTTQLRDGSDGLAVFARRLGQRRARQGIPLDRLVKAIRLDLRIVWQMLLRLAGPERAPVLVQHVEQVMMVLDDYIDDVQSAFSAEVALLQRDSRLATEQHLSRLFNATTLSPALLREIAEGIGIDFDSMLEVILVRPTAVHDEPVREPRREIQHWLGKREVFAYAYRGWLLLFRARGDELSTWPKEFSRVPSVYVDRVSGLAGVAAAARAAVELHASTPAITRLYDLEELWAAGSESYLHSLLPGYFRAILEGIKELPDDEQERLTSTVQAFLDSGSVKTTASAMACHRNTVVNRLKLFHELTGLDVTVPRQAALAFILLSRSDVTA